MGSMPSKYNRDVSKFRKSGLSFVLAVCLVFQSVLAGTGGAMARTVDNGAENLAIPPSGTDWQIVEICTGQGFKKIAVDSRGDRIDLPAPASEHVHCAECVLAPAFVLGLRTGNSSPFHFFGTEMAAVLPQEDAAFELVSPPPPLRAPPA